MSDLKCTDVLKKLLRAGINYEGDGLRNYLDSQDDVPTWQTALIWDTALRGKLWEAMMALQRELVPQHISLQDLYTKLWELFKEIAINRADYQSAARLQQKINYFANEVKKPLMAYDVIYEIKNIDIGSRSFNIGDIEILRLTKEHLKTSKPEKYAIPNTLVDLWEGKIAASMEVNASTTDGANIIGGTDIERALNLLRIATRGELIGRSFDSLFLWELGISLVIAKTLPEEGRLFSMFNNQEIYPFIADISASLERILDRESVWSQIIQARLPEDIQRRVDRAVEWISLAIMEHSLDHKLVHLCTALEVLLLPDHNDGTKGELIALRQVLMGQGTYESPTGILSLYEQRCNVIHGGYLDITTYYEYWYLLLCCFNILRNIIHLSQRNPEIMQLKTLLGIVEDEESLGKFIKQCEIGIHKGKGINSIKKAAEDRLKQIKKN